MLVSDGPMLWGIGDPQRIAVARGGSTTTYGELRARAQEFSARVSSEMQAGPGHPIWLAFPDSAELLAAFLGTVEAGAMAVPVNLAWSAEQIQPYRASCEPAGVLCGEGASASMLQLASEVSSQASAPVANLPAGSMAPFYVGFSSGSTGKPKAIMRDNQAWVQSFRAMSLEFGIGTDSTVAIPGSLFYSFSLIAALHALFIGATVVLPERTGFAGALDVLNDSPDVLYILPSLLGDVLRRSEGTDRRFAGLQAVICAGEKLPPATRAAAAGVFPDAQIFEYYGASELGFVTIMPPEEGERRGDSVGRPFLGSRLAVLDGQGNTLPPGEVGLVCAQTGYGYCGYLGDPEGTRRTDHFGWQTVGDLGWLDDDGYLHLAGRQDGTLVIRGENIAVEEVERELLACPGVISAAALGEPAESPTHLVAFVEAQGTSPDQVLAAIRHKLTGRALPRRVEFLETLPRTDTGKLDRRKLQALLAGSPED